MNPGIGGSRTIFASDAHRAPNACHNAPGQPLPTVTPPANTAGNALGTGSAEVATAREAQRCGKARQLRRSTR
jgi:hypothetical protein